MNYTLWILASLLWQLAAANTETVSFYASLSELAPDLALTPRRVVHTGKNRLSVSFDPITHLAPGENTQHTEIWLDTSQLAPVQHFARVCWPATAPVNVALRSEDGHVLLTIDPDYYSTNTAGAKRHLTNVPLDVHIGQQTPVPRDLWPVVVYVGAVSVVSIAAAYFAYVSGLLFGKMC
ncbi:hypothetical protein OGAPHI_002955 [Ogataea philodendri]|uniref:Protein PBN1 n=1 Tax=Ogataea philodendri TaxID=1378263 RepID=A0A9P8T606_9ASCO|nr:uncharacterized protein OGAPHI_002955 [Ogataea philodendri]KAH3667306.1 hypothetical protein OGAPHI_002955 [Ogataea philodendri]